MPATRSGSKPIRGGMSVPGRWFLTPKEIFMDIKGQQARGYFVYRGHLDKEGNIVVEKGLIYTRGNFALGAPQPTVFKKAY